MCNLLVSNMFLLRSCLTFLLSFFLFLLQSDSSLDASSVGSLSGRISMTSKSRSQEAFSCAIALFGDSYSSADDAITETGSLCWETSRAGEQTQVSGSTYSCQLTLPAQCRLQIRNATSHLRYLIGFLKTIYFNNQ